MGGGIGDGQGIGGDGWEVNALTGPKRPGNLWMSAKPFCHLPVRLPEPLEAKRDPSQPALQVGMAHPKQKNTTNGE